MCLGEIARKIDGKIVAPYVVGLMETLKRTFLDERWHVRDAACLASGSFFVNFPSQCQGLLESVFPLFFENLQFPISIVRQGAAAALANIIRAYGTAVLPMIMEKIIAGLDGIENQSSETSVNVDLQVFNPQLVSNNHLLLYSSDTISLEFTRDLKLRTLFALEICLFSLP